MKTFYRILLFAICMFYCGCNEKASGELDLEKEEPAVPLNFHLQTNAFTAIENYTRKSLVALLADQGDLDGGLFDVEGYFYINSKPQCYLYFDPGSLNQEMSMNSVFLAFASDLDEKTVLAQAKSTKLCRVLGEFRTKSEVDYGWSSGTIHVHRISALR